MVKFFAFRSAVDLSIIPSTARALGIEVPPTAAREVHERCDLGIIDPQHTDGELHCAVVEVDRAILTMGMNRAVDAFFQAVAKMEEVWLITPRFDLDSAASMARLACAARGKMSISSNVVERLMAINAADTFAAGAALWPGPRPLPTLQNPWPNVGGAGEIEKIAAPNHLTGWTWSGPKLALEVVVEAVAYWIQNGQPDAKHFDDPVAAAKHAAEQGDMIALLQAAACDARKARVEIATALESGTLKPEIHNGFVFFDMLGWRGISTATAGVGYCLAPVTTIEMIDGRSRCRRFSIAAFNRASFDFHGFVQEANAMETSGGRWGGAPGSCMIGSPQDRETSLTREEFLALVKKHLRK